MDPYATPDELADYLRVTGTTYEGDFAEVLDGATSEITTHCGRYFGRDDPLAPATTRSFRVKRYDVAEVADFWTTDDLQITTDDGGTGSFGTTWGQDDYQLEPLDGIRDGLPGWPYFRIVALGDRSFPTGRRAGLRVTAHWGWAAVPKPVKLATLMLAAETFKMREAPLGVAGWSDMGVIRVRDVPQVARMLYPFERDRVKVAWA